MIPVAELPTATSAGFAAGFAPGVVALAIDAFAPYEEATKPNDHD